MKKAIDQEAPHARLALSPDEAATVLSVSRTTVWRLITRKELPSFSVSARCRRIPYAALEAYIAARLEAEAS